MTPHSSRYFRSVLRRFTSGVTAFAMASVGLVGVPIIAQIAGAQPAAAGTYSAVAYVANFNAGNVTAVNVNTNATLATITVGTHPTGVAFSPDGKKVYVANQGSNSVSVITTASNTVTKTITVGTSPWGMRSRRTAPRSTSPTTAPGQSASSRLQRLRHNTVTVGSSPAGLGITPDGTKVLVTNNGASTVSVIATTNNTIAATITVATGPRVVAIAPDGVTAYVASTGVDTVTPITVATNTPLTGISSPGGPYGAAFVPDQAPTAALAAVTSREAMTSVTFDASASTHSCGTITSYAWDFGDTLTATTAGPTTTHTYALDGSYTASVTVTDTVGTSMTQVFTGQTMSRNGKATARTTGAVTISTPFTVTAASPVGFNGSITGTNQILSTTMPLNVSNGLAAGWSISATSTQWTTGGGSPKVLPLTATTVGTTPIVTCDVGVGSCNLATNSIGYPYVLPAGATAPNASKIFNAASNTGIGRQTVTPTLKL